MHGTEIADQAVGTAAAYGRFETGDLTSLLSATNAPVRSVGAGNSASLAQGTSSWAAFGAATQTDTGNTTAGGKETA